MEDITKCKGCEIPIRVSIMAILTVKEVGKTTAQSSHAGYCAECFHKEEQNV